MINTWEEKFIATSLCRFYSWLSRVVADRIWDHSHWQSTLKMLYICIYITVHISCSQLSRLQSKILHLFIIQSLVRNSTWPDVQRSFSLNLLDKPDKASKFWFYKVKFFKTILIFLTILTRVLYFGEIIFLIIKGSTKWSN